MKPHDAKTKTAGIVLFALSALTCLAISTMKVKPPMQIVSDPPGAMVDIDTEPVGLTPFTTNRVRSDKDLEVEVTLKDYFAEKRTFSQKEVALHTRDHNVPWILTIPLSRRHLETPLLVSSSVDGATVFVNGQEAGLTPWNGKLVFDIAAKSDRWEPSVIRVEKSNYLAVSKLFSEEQSEARDFSGRFNATLDEIKREVEVKVSANVPHANVFINDGLSLGTTPCTVRLTFTRADGTQLWSTSTVKISKEGYEYLPLGGEAKPEFVQKMTADSAAGGFVSANSFVPVKFVSVPLRTFGIINDKIQVCYTNVSAAVDQTEPGGQAPTAFTTAAPEDALVLSKFSVWPDHPDKIVYSKLTRDPRSPAGTDEVLTGANIWSKEPGQDTPMTKGVRYDIDPFVTADGKFIYFSSNRSGKQAIWRMEPDGAAPQPITVNNINSVDTEPVVTFDNAKLAYSSRPLGALPSTPSTIWIADADGSLAASTQPGHSPAWSPDGKLIVYVSPPPGNKIMLMDRKGRPGPQLTDGEWNDAFPIWSHEGKHIIFASDRGLNDRNERNWDLWIMTPKGKDQAPLTQNGSFDSCPAISSDNLRLYFFSNRGAVAAGKESLQIFWLEPPRD
jgi:hypothetical protein